MDNLQYKRCKITLKADNIRTMYNKRTLKLNIGNVLMVLRLETDPINFDIHVLRGQILTLIVWLF